MISNMLSLLFAVEALASLLRSSSLHRLGLAGSALGTAGAVHLILTAELGRELETKLTGSGAGGLPSAFWTMYK